MSIIEDFTVGAKSCAENVGRKADDVLSVSKLKLKQTMLQNDISKKLKLMGAKVYKAKVTGVEDEGIDKDVDEITKLYAQLKETKENLKRAKESLLTLESKKDK